MILSQIKEVNGVSSKTDADKIIQAAITMLDYAVTANKKVKAHFKGFREKRANIRLLHYRFADVHQLEITNEDLFDVIMKYGHRKNVILYIDPPYYLTNGCYSENMSDHDSHEKLAELLHKTKCKWVLFCRSQASRSRNMHQNSGLVDDSLRCFYENHYLYKGCYYKKWIDHKTEELVITNFEFKDCDFYGKPKTP